jgi:putative ABC transport system permease protein
MNLARLAFRNGFRRDAVRGILTVLSVALLVTAFLCIRTAVSSFYSGPANVRSDRLLVGNRISLALSLPLADLERIKGIPGVTKVTHMSWFGGIYLDGRNEFPRFAIDPDTFFDVYPEGVVSPEDLAAFRADRTGCLVGNKLAKKLGFKKGDIVRIKGDFYPGDWAFHVDGVATTEDLFESQTMLFQWKYLDGAASSAERGYVQRYAVVVDDAAHSAAVAQAIDAAFAGSAHETRTESEKAFILEMVASSSTLVGVLDALSCVLLILMMLIVGNTLAMALRERSRELAVLRTLGFRPQHLLVLGVLEGGGLALAGGLLGIALSPPILKELGDASLGLVQAGLMWRWAVPSLATTVAVGLLASLWPAYRASRIEVAAAFRDLE